MIEVRTDWFGTRHRWRGWTVIDFTWVAQLIIALMIFGGLWVIMLGVEWLMN